MEWPTRRDELRREQERLAGVAPPPWAPPAETYGVGGCFVCFPRRRPGVGAWGDPAWAGAALLAADGRLATAYRAGAAGERYEAGMLALREGPLLESVVRRLPEPPEVLLVNATGRDHPRRAGLACHLGAMLELPTVGVTHRPLLAEGEWPALERGARAPLLAAADRVGYWLCTRTGARPLAVHAAWRTSPEVAVEVVLRATAGRARTPEPIRAARRVAREARAASG